MAGERASENSRGAQILQLFGFFITTIIALALVGCDMVDSQLCAWRLVGYLSSHIQQARVGVI